MSIYLAKINCGRLLHFGRNAQEKYGSVFVVRIHMSLENVQH